ncbi:MAG: hypothetical protein CXX75_00125 [Methanobacteriota archaeon]|nr:MAG: hypothetical protein CXX75_00125 [Euryarchaeota archaeon]
MVTQQLECPVCFIRFDTGRRPGRSVACPSCDHGFDVPGEEAPAAEEAPATEKEAVEEEAPDEEMAADEETPEEDEAEDETPQGDPSPAPPSEPPVPPEPAAPSALELLGELSTAYRVERLQSVIDGPRSRAQLAGLLLLAVAVLGLFAATATAIKWSGYDSPWDEPATASLYGSVIDVNGTALENVRVAGGGQQVFSDGEGRYFLHNLTSGELKVTFFSPGFRTHSIWIDLRPAATNLLNAQLEPGDGRDVTNQRSNIARPWPPSAAQAPVLAVMALLALMGAGAALLERHFRLALFGAVAGILSWGFLLGSLLSLAALLLLLGDRERFEE